MTLDSFIFTKDRACQLRLLLESIDRNAPNVFHHHILWKASSPAFAAGYAMLREEFPDANWIEEREPIKDEFLKVIRLAGKRSGTLTIFTDDCVFYRREAVDPGIIKGMLDTSLTFSFRLGHNTVVQNYVTGERQPPLRNYEMKHGLLEWDYRNYDWRQNNGYWAGMDGHCFLTTDLMRLTKDLPMKTFRDWEGALHLPKNRDSQPKAKMSCFPRSCVVNLPVNSVQSDPTPSGTRHARGLEELNDEFLAGKVIDLDAIDFSNIQSCHIELPLTFKERSH